MKNTRKAGRTAAVMVLIVMTLAMTVSSFAASEITLDEAEKIALKDAKVTRSEVKRFESERDGGKYEVEFKKKSNGTEFEYVITKTGKIRKKSVDYVYKKNHSKAKIGIKAARKRRRSTPV